MKVMCVDISNLKAYGGAQRSLTLYRVYEVFRGEQRTDSRFWYWIEDDNHVSTVLERHSHVEGLVLSDGYNDFVFAQFIEVPDEDAVHHE
jgi:hypothetical protein